MDISSGAIPACIDSGMKKDEFGGQVDGKVGTHQILLYLEKGSLKSHHLIRCAVSPSEGVVVGEKIRIRHMKSFGKQ